METIIKITPSEFDENLIDKIKAFIGNKKNVDVIISIRDFDGEYVDSLNTSIAQAEDNTELVSFTMDDFMAYTPTK